MRKRALWLLNREFKAGAGRGHGSDKRYRYIEETCMSGWLRRRADGVREGEQAGKRDKKDK